MELAQLGLIVIALAWIIQLIYSIKGKKEIQPLFIIGYILGVLLLVISTYLAGAPTSYYELLTLVAALIVLIFSFEKKRK